MKLTEVQHTEQSRVSPVQQQAAYDSVIPRLYQAEHHCTRNPDRKQHSDCQIMFIV